MNTRRDRTCRPSSASRIAGPTCESTFHSGDLHPRPVNISHSAISRLQSPAFLPRSILHSAISTLHSSNPHGTAFFCIVPRNEICLRSIQNRPEPRLGHPNSRQRSGLRRSHVALLRRPMGQKSPAIPHIPLNSTYALPPNPATA